jgi:hypothetical protein
MGQKLRYTDRQVVSNHLTTDRPEDLKVPRSVFLTSPVPPNQTFDGTWFNIKQLDR